MRVFKTIIHILANISYFLILLYVIICIPILFGHKPMIVLSNSMSPVFKKGYLIYYDKNIKVNELKDRDIIAFNVQDKKIISHRIYEIKENKILTKGDNNNSIDPFTVKYENILGRVDGVKAPYIGYFVAFVNSHLYLIVVIFFILLFEFFLSNVNIKIGNNNQDIEDSSSDID